MGPRELKLIRDGLVGPEGERAVQSDPKNLVVLGIFEGGYAGGATVLLA